MIKISIKAYGCVGDDYDGKETVQSKLLEKVSEDPSLTEKDLKSILESLITSVKEIKGLYPDEQADVAYHNDNRLESIKFEITFNDKNDSANIIEEKSFFKEVAKHNSLSSLVIEYCDVTDDGEEGIRIQIMDEYNQAPPAGTYAMLALVNQSKKWVSNYIEFLRTNDLDREVEQIWDIKSIIEKYGWCKETVRLAVARNIGCCGQAGRQQFNDFLNDGLENHLNPTENRKEFIDFILQEFEEWDKVGFELENGHKKHYINGIVNYVKHFDKILSKDEIKNIETSLLNKWENYHKD